LVLTSLHRLRDGKRKNLFCEVYEKGKTREFALPITLAIQTLEFIWDQRHIFIERRRLHNPVYVAPRNVFLSSKTGGSMSPAAIGNLLKAAFKNAGVKGSGHRLRASYSEQVVLDAYLRAKAAHGRYYDVRAVLSTAKDSLGHKDQKTFKRYLNRLIRRDQIAEGYPVLILNTNHAAKVRAFAKALNDGEPAAAVELDRIMAALQLIPLEPPEHAPRRARNRARAAVSA
jgi:integrase